MSRAAKRGQEQPLQEAEPNKNALNSPVLSHDVCENQQSIRKVVAEMRSHGQNVLNCGNTR